MKADKPWYQYEIKLWSYEHYRFQNNIFLIMVESNELRDVQALLVNLDQLSYIILAW